MPQKKPKVIEISLPEYKIDKRPNYDKLGRKIDKIIEQNFPDGKYIIRAIGADNHPNLSLNELVKIILKSGTDRYDSKREAVCHKEFSMYDYEIHAGTMKIKDSKIVPNKEDKYKTIFGGFIYNFYENAPLDRGYSVRIDLLLIYDANKLEPAKLINSKFKKVRPAIEKCLYKFKNPKKKKEALIGIIKILRWNHKSSHKEQKQ